MAKGDSSKRWIMRLVRGFLPMVALVMLLHPVGTSAAGRADPAASLFELPFAAATVDPATDLAPSDPRGRGLVLVQVERFGLPDMPARLASTGAVLVQPLAPVSYIVWADETQTQTLRQLEEIRFAGVLPPAFRIHPSVSAASERLRVTLVGDARSHGVGRDAAWDRAFTALGGTVVTMDGGLDLARELARRPDVYSISDATEPPGLRDEQSAQIAAGNLGKNGEPEPGYRRFLRRIKTDGSGVVISQVDTGVDFNHPDLQGRVKGCFDYLLPGPVRCSVANNEDVIGHGTHTAGIIVGTGNSGLSDADGFRYGQGMAPGAELVVQNAITVGADVTSDPFYYGYRGIYRDAQKLGAIVSANSWGPSGRPRGYDDATREFDTIPRDANERKRGDQPLAVVLSIMNGRGGRSTQGTPDEGKNLIRVGASGSRRPYVAGTRNQNGDPPTGALPPDVRPQDLCFCSAHGPALDGRLLPDVVAPGQQVVSARATQGVLCGLPGNTRQVPPSPFHGPCTGTSMASPHVSGGYAVFVEWYRKRFSDTPSPALVKAAFVNGAVDLSRLEGVDADGKKLTPIPNNEQGWGRFDLGEVIRGWSHAAVHLDQTMVFTSAGQARDLRVRAVDPSRPLKATLAWTDAPGHGLGGKLPAWVNDLDLEVASGRASWLGNVFAGGWSVSGGSADRMNNVENVYLRSPGTATYTVTVRAANLIGDALPNSPGYDEQDFALVITNARRVQ